MNIVGSMLSNAAYDLRKQAAAYREDAFDLDAGIPTDASPTELVPLPKSIRVGFKTYDILPWPIENVIDDASLGRCEHFKSQIHVAVGGRAWSDVAETLIHEILHACWYVARLEDAPPEEKAVATLASGLAQVLSDNPALRAWLNDVYGGP